MGAGESRPTGDDVPIITLGADVDDDGRDAGFGADVSKSEQAAAEMAAVAAAQLSLSPHGAAAAPAEGSQFVVTASEGQPLAVSLDEYKMEGKDLGEGAFGKVKLARSKTTGHQVAVKIIKRNKINARAEELLVREVRHHGKLRHDNIVRLHTWIKTPSKYYLVMEYCPDGDLLNFLNTSGALKDKVARALFSGLMNGVHFCHGLGIYHRDIKLENLMLIKSDDGEPPMVKIADFGLSDLKTPGDYSLTFCGSPLYAAPELMTAGKAPDGYDASKSDMWSCGVVLYALLCSALPFDASDITTLVRLIQKGEPIAPVPKSRGEPAKSLVTRMMQVEAQDRPSATEVLSDPWLGEEDPPQPITTAQTMAATLPSVAAAAAAAAPEAAAEAVSAGGSPQAEQDRRRGASATTAYFKSMLAKERAATTVDLKKVAEVPAPLAPLVEPPAAAPPRQRGQPLTKAEREAIMKEKAEADGQ